MISPHYICFSFIVLSFPFLPFSQYNYGTFKPRAVVFPEVNAVQGKKEHFYIIILIRELLLCWKLKIPINQERKLKIELKAWRQDVIWSCLEMIMKSTRLRHFRMTTQQEGDMNGAKVRKRLMRKGYNSECVRVGVCFYSANKWIGSSSHFKQNFIHLIDATIPYS